MVIRKKKGLTLFLIFTMIFALSLVKAPVVKADTNKVLILQDALPWNQEDVTQKILTNMVVNYDIKPSSTLASLDLSPYSVIIVSSDQTQNFYDKFQQNMGKIQSFVHDGGTLEFNGADVGWNGGMWDTLLETIHHVINYDLFNYVNFDSSEQAIWTGVPGTFSDFYASHGYFTDLPDNAQTITFDDNNQPTTVDFSYGSGRVVASTVTLEWGYSKIHPDQNLLPNIISYCLSIQSISAKSHEIVVLIPGVYGSWSDQIDQPYDPNSPDNNDGWFPGFEGNSITQYSDTLNPMDSLRETFEANGFKKDKDLFVFAYDWRRSNAVTANLLNEKLGYYEKTFREAMGYGDAEPVHITIVAHSMGGSSLVISWRRLMTNLKI